MQADLAYCVALRPTAFFMPSEEVDADHVRRLADAIRATGLWTTPIPIERDTGIVMDGNHRIRAAALLGLHHLPCVLLDYADPRVSVTHWGRARRSALPASGSVSWRSGACSRTKRHATASRPRCPARRSR